LEENTPVSSSKITDILNTLKLAIFSLYVMYFLRLINILKYFFQIENLQKCFGCISVRKQCFHHNHVPQIHIQICACVYTYMHKWLSFLLALSVLFRHEDMKQLKCGVFQALDVFWHEDCLKCGCCDCRLGEVGSTLYTKANLILCKRDYLRLVTFQLSKQTVARCSS
jgi:hypothetical protein